MKQYAHVHQFYKIVTLLLLFTSIECIGEENFVMMGNTKVGIKTVRCQEEQLIILEDMIAVDMDEGIEPVMDTFWVDNQLHAIIPISYTTELLTGGQ